MGGSNEHALDMEMIKGTDGVKSLRSWQTIAQSFVAEY
jgi:hypothetical protein